mgnify:CR=1 FL=1
MYDVVWSDAEQKCVVRSVTLRFVGDNILDRHRMPDGRRMKDAQLVCDKSNK